MPGRFVVGALTAALVLFVIVYPLAVTRYAPMTDLPFHAANTSIFRNYLDASFHFREQFELQPLAVPYATQYLVGAILMLVLPPVVATHVAAGFMLLLLPGGLATLLWGLRKSPLLCLACLPLCWGGLTQWGFLSFVGALGLFAMSIGLALRLLDRPTRARQIALTVSLVALFFTHIFRFPFAVAGVVAAAIVLYPVTRTMRPILLPVGVAVSLFAAWRLSLPAALDPDFGSFEPRLERLEEIGRVIFGGFHDPREGVIVARWLIVLAAVAVAAAATPFALGSKRRRSEGRRARLWWVGSHLVPLGAALAFGLLFLTLPMQAGIWWYIYPREALAACFIALALLPDLPRHPIVRTALVGVLAVPGLQMSTFVARQYEAFDRSTEDFHAITRQIPQAPRLLYLVFDHRGSTRTSTPFIHLPAYVQAEKGGWLSFHFATWGASPIVYRDDVPPETLPPPTPLRWEWTPQRFRVADHGAWFDWFLIRRRDAPDGLLAADPTIERVDHVGMWWLYRRRSEPASLPP